ncbi:MAG: right-handed parallel beta-helix repeat-containing protein [Acidobacteriaceae bacterium]|nr:right-handed parallel beta-helix repeat-containing protein [Acidobacteriaceae bacterium]
MEFWNTYRTQFRRAVRRALVVLVLFAQGLLKAQTTTTLTPTAYVTTQGASSGQSVSVLGTMDQAGVESNSSNYVEFEAAAAGAAYAGYTTYTLPTSIAPSSVTGIQILANYVGPSVDTQTWSWQIYDWNHSAYVPVGTNVMATANGSWKLLNFNVWGKPSNYVNASNGQIRVQLVSSNAASNAYLDYEAVVVTSNSSNPTTDNSYYVSKSGNDANAGSLSAPWLTLQHAASTVAAGSTVYVEGGTYNEVVTFNVCGSSSGGMIRFQSYPGQTAILDGTGVTIPYSTSSDPGSRGLVQISNCSYVSVEGFTIRNITPNTSSVFPAAISINGNSSYVQIRGNTIYNVNNGVYGAHGIGVYANSSSGANTNMVIDGNLLYNLVLGYSESIHIDGDVQYFSVTNNQVHDTNNIGIDALGGYGTSSLVDQARNGTISGNLVYNATDSANPDYTNGSSAAGIYIDGGGYIVIENNITHDNDIGIQVSSEQSGKLANNVTVRNNVIYHNRSSGLSVGGYSTGVGSTTQSTFVNNTLFENESLQNGLGEVNLQYFPTTVSGNLFENNIVYANTQGILISSFVGTPQVTLDYNLYYAPSGTSSSRWIWNSSGYSTLTAWSGTQNDTHAQYADPGFLQIANLPPNLFLGTSSPARGAGSTASALNVGSFDFNGQPRVVSSAIDVGAYEASATGSSSGSTGTVYLSTSSSNTLGGSAVIQSCSGCASGQTVGYIGEGGTLTFNNVSAASAGTHSITISYEDGDAGRSATMTVNGTATTLSFTGSDDNNWTTPHTLTVSVTLNSGSSNTISFSNASAYAPDIDQITVY